MASDDNVVKMPDRLERIAQKIEAAMTRRNAGEDEWIEGTLDLTFEMGAARAECGDDDGKFGAWLKGRFGDNRISHQERAILIKWSKMPRPEVSVMLETANSRSIRGIDQAFTKSGKGEPLASGGPKLQQAKDRILAYEASTGKLPPADRHFQMPGITPSTYDRAIREVRGARAQAETLGPLKFTKAQDHHVEARLKFLSRQLESEFTERVRLGILEKNADYLAGVEELRKKASVNERFYRQMIERNEKNGIFTEAEFENIRFCLHPDNSASSEKRSSAFVTFNLKKLQLTGKK